MSKTKRIISMLLTFVILLSATALFSCSADKKNLKVVGYVNGYEVHYEELRWLTMQFKDRMEETYGEGIWDDKETAEKYREELQNAVYSGIVANYAILTLCDELNENAEGDMKFIDINGETEQGLIDQYVADTIEEFGSKSAYKQGLRENYLTENLYRFITGIDICESILFNYYCNLTIIDDSEEAAIDYIYKNFIRTVHVYIENGKDENIEDNRRLAAAIREKLDNGEPMDELIEKYNEDKNSASATGYYFPKGTYSEAYENAAFALEANEISDVVETYSGFYIIQRLELDGAYIGANFLTGAKFKDRYLLAMMDEIVDECKAGLTFSPNEYGSSIDLTEMK